MGSYAAQLNKALLPLGNRAIITHIMERFAVEAEFVIGVGHLHEQVEQYMRIAHPERKITVVEVSNYDGPGSGPGHSLACCKQYLQRPFYFVSCDTLWENEMPLQESRNWLGVAAVPNAETDRYCNVRVENDLITEVRDKQSVGDPAFQAFVGLCHIFDYQVFWQGLESHDLIAGEQQVSNGLRALIYECDVEARPVVWTDVGDSEKYRRAALRFAEYDFSKADEYFYQVGSKVIKYFVDHKVSEMRVSKAALNPKIFPVITDHAGGFYAYELEAGETLYEYSNQRILRQLLEWLEAEVWRLYEVKGGEIQAACRRFYRDKTLKRLEAFEKKYPTKQSCKVINGTAVPPLEELLGRVPWSQLEEGIACFIHGDLQFDNILFNRATGRFKLLDWRQEFGGNIAFGDLYYDLAKLRGGILVNYDYIKRNLLYFEEAGNEVNFDFARRYQTGAYLEILDTYVQERGLDLKRVRLLVAIIYLNMAALHKTPFDKLLYSLGHVLLHTELT